METATPNFMQLACQLARSHVILFVQNNNINCLHKIHISLLLLLLIFKETLILMCDRFLYSCATTTASTAVITLLLLFLAISIPKIESNQKKRPTNKRNSESEDKNETKRKNLLDVFARHTAAYYVKRQHLLLIHLAVTRLLLLLQYVDMLICCFHLFIPQ